MQIAESGQRLSFRRLGAALDADPTAIYRQLIRKHCAERPHPARITAVLSQLPGARERSG
jgi:hypothetical protein